MSGPYHPLPGERYESISMAAFRGDAEAQYRLGEVLRRGLLGQTVDERQARYWYNRAARGGHRSAAFLVNNWRNRHHFK